MDTIRENSFLMIKKIILFNILFIIVSAQDADSLFWFDANSLQEDPPQFPIVINKVFTGNHIFILDSIKQLKSKVNEGFRIQIFESMVSSIARAEAKRFQNILGDTFTLILKHHYIN